MAKRWDNRGKAFNGATPASTGGFTLLELLVSLVIVAFLALMAAPAFQGMMGNSRIASATADLVSSLTTAKSESIGRSQSVTLCKSSDGAACTTSGGWHQGWIIFVDADRDAVIDSGEEVLYTHDGFTGNVTVYGTSGVADRVTYRPSGTTHFTTAQTFMFCDSRGFGEEATGIMLSVIGRATSHRATDTGQTTCLAPV